MRAMVFAAGEGKRMLPLTETVPKPLLEVAGRSLLSHVLAKIASAGVSETVVNAAYLSEQVVHSLESMCFPGMQCNISIEDEPLETGGGLVKALPLLGDEHFFLCNSDVWTDYDIRALIQRRFEKEVYAHLILVPSPEHNRQGDFCLMKDGSVVQDIQDRVSKRYLAGRFTFSGLSVIHPSLIREYSNGRTHFPMRDLLFAAMQDGRVTGELYEGLWMDIGTPSRLEELRAMLA